MKRTAIVSACLVAAACAPATPSSSGDPAAQARPSASVPSASVPATPSPPVAPSSTRPSGERAEGGCGDTPAQSGRPPAWASVNAPRLPFVVGREGNALAYPFVDLRAGTPENPANKVLWYVRLPRDSNELRVVARPRGAAEPVVRAAFPDGAGPGEIYPSIINVPKPGCWTFDLTWGAHHDTVDVLYRR
ncbi:hypothetical protein GCM10022226_63330 [Sphaerisporangium flaviroseum]|uniref:Uncharacterized protein n=1 Tax=Sphaerisporangium flaviroseum TaxID=509199 RepID=A0ABP7J2R3_9ACTN